MIGVLEIATIRQLFPDEDLYYIRIASRDFIFRTITPSEFATIKEISKTNLDQEDLVTQTSLVYPSAYNVLEGEAGIPKVISELVLKFSLLNPDSRDAIINRFLSYTNELESDMDSQMPVIIKMAFPEFTFEQIESWTVDIKLKNYARALLACKLKGYENVQGYVIEEPEEQREISEEDEVKMLEDQGIDPVVALYDRYKPIGNVLDFPFISGNKWNNEEINYAIRQQIHRSSKRQK